MTDNMQLQRVIGLVEEEDYMVTPAANTPDFHMEVTKSSIKIDGEPLKFDSGLSRDVTKVRPGPYVPNPEFESTMDLKTIGHILKGVLGSYVFTEGEGTAKNIHEIYGGNNMLLPSFTLWGHFDNFIKKVKGFIFNNFTMEVSNEWIKITVKGLAGKDSKTNGVPDPTNLKTLTGVIPLAYYDMALEFDGEVPPGIVSSIKWEVNNNIKSDDASGIGSRFIVRKPAAGKRENTLETEVSLEPETVKYIEMFEYGEEGATEPSACKIAKIPLKLVISACENPSEKLTILFPENAGQVEYDASGSDAMTQKISFTGLGNTETELKDEVTKVLSSVVCTLENDIPELTPGGVVMQVTP